MNTALIIPVISNVYVLLELFRYPLDDEPESNEGCLAVGVLFSKRVKRSAQAHHSSLGLQLDIFAVAEFIVREQLH